MLLLKLISSSTSQFKAKNISCPLYLQSSLYISILQSVSFYTLIYWLLKNLKLTETGKRITSKLVIV